MMHDYYALFSDEQYVLNRQFSLKQPELANYLAYQIMLSNANAGAALGFKIDGAHNYPHDSIKPCQIFKISISTECL